MPKSLRYAAIALALLLLPSAAFAVDPILIGGTLSQSGAYAEPSWMLERGYEVWVEDVNAAGGLLGRPVELIILDDKSSAALVTEGYRRLIDDLGVDLVVSPYGTPNTLAAAAVTEARGYPMVASSSSSDAPWEQGYDRLFGVYALARRYFIGQLDLMAREGHSTVALVHEESPFSRDCAEGVLEWAPRFGMEVSTVISYPPGSLPARNITTTLEEDRPDGVVACTYPDDGYALLSAFEARSYRPKALGMTIAPVHPQFRDRVGEYAEGIFAPSQWEPDERIPFPGTAEFIDDFVNATGVAPSYHAGSAFASCQILQAAVEAAGRIDHDAIAQHIKSLDTVTIIGRFKTDSHGAQIGHNSILIQWQDGAKEIVYPRSIRTADARF